MEDGAAAGDGVEVEAGAVAVVVADSPAAAEALEAAVRVEVGKERFRESSIVI